MDETSAHVSQKGTSEKVSAAEPPARDGGAPPPEAPVSPEADSAAAAPEKGWRASKSFVPMTWKWLLKNLWLTLKYAVVVILLQLAYNAIVGASTSTQFVLGLSVVIMLMLLLLWTVPKWQVASIGGVAPNVRFELENEARKTLAQILAGIIVVTGIYGTWRTLQVSEQTQVTERFNKALEQLSSQSPVTKLGAIYSLDRIAEDSPRDRIRIIELLTTYVKENAPFNKSAPSPSASPKPQQAASPEPQKQAEDEDETIKAALLTNARADVQAALNVLRKSAPTPNSEYIRIDLSNVDLTSVYLYDADFSHADFSHAGLTGGKFIKVNLTSAFFFDADLRAASFVDTQLKDAYFTRANLKWASFDNADVGGADFVGANNLTAEQFKDARNVEKAKLPEDVAKALGLAGR